MGLDAADDESRYACGMRFTCVFILAAVVSACSSTPSVDTAADATTATQEAAMTTDHAEVLQVTLLPTTSATTVGGAVMVQMQVHNPSSSPATFCIYHTLFEGLRNNLFVVKDDAGVEVSYAGIMAKRGPPGPKDFKTVAAGETIVSTAVDVGAAYPLRAGKSTVTFAGNGISGLGAAVAPIDVDVAVP